MKSIHHRSITYYPTYTHTQGNYNKFKIKKILQIHNHICIEPGGIEISRAQSILRFTEINIMTFTQKKPQLDGKRMSLET